jgi:hypothetical protein
MPSPLTVAEALDQIYERKHELDPEEVVRVARNPKSILHDHFEWDDTLAGHQHRVDQARSLIRQVKVRIPTPGGEEAQTIRVRAWHAASAVGRDSAVGYVPESEVRVNPMERGYKPRHPPSRSRQP